MVIELTFQVQRMVFCLSMGIIMETRLMGNHIRGFLHKLVVFHAFKR